MIDILAPLALLLMGLFVVLIGVTARKQRRERADVFRALARRHGWRFLETDDGTAERLAEGFRDFAVFHSASLGEHKPESVVLGDVPEGNICLFVHGTREWEGNARLWTICLLACSKHVGPTARIRPREVRHVREINDDPVVTFGGGRFDQLFEVRSPRPEQLRSALDEGTRKSIVDQAEALPFTVEIQILGDRVAVYPGRRNDQAGDVEELERMVALARSVAGGGELDRS